MLISAMFDSSLLRTIEMVWREREAMLRLTSPIIRDALKWADTYRLLLQKQNRLERMLLQLGWPPPGLLPAPFVDAVSLEFERGGLTGGDVEELFVDAYHPQRLAEMVNEWRAQGHFPHRMRILEAAVQAHNEGRFELSIPALLPQIEGALADVFAHQGRISGRDVEDYITRALQDDLRFNRAAAAFYLTIVLAVFEWGNPIPPLSRHAILHGADTEYASAANSLRLILMFDVLQSATMYVAVPTSRRYHSPLCAALRGRTPRRTFRSQFKAHESGLTPCTRCLRHLL